VSSLLSRDSWVFLLRGVLAIVLGVLAFLSPGPTLAALILVFAFYAVFDGILAIVAGFAFPGGPSLWLIVGGIAGIAVGAFTFVSPDTTAVAVVLLVGIWAIATGAAEFIAAATLGDRIQNRFLLGLTGAISVAFGVLLVMSPTDGILSVLWLIGFYAIFAGVTYLAMGMRLRGVANTLESIKAENTATTA
jgi:uncharacterized membrane protein HdeD (DUF308 family)